MVFNKLSLHAVLRSRDFLVEAGARCEGPAPVHGSIFYNMIFSSFITTMIKGYLKSKYSIMNEFFLVRKVELDVVKKMF